MTMPIVPMQGNRPYPPRLTAFTTTFWSELAKGRFLLSRCEECGHGSFPPKRICPICWCRKIAWAEHPGQGVVYSYTTVHAAPAYFQAELPFMVCVVDLQDGPRVATRLIGEHTGPLFGARAELVTLQYDDGVLFAAKPVAS
jgi:uncharacterized protein